VDADVGGGGDGVEQHPGHDEPDAPGRRRRGRENGEGAVDGQPDDDDVADRAHARQLPQRDPGQQHERAHGDRDGAERPAQVAGEALVQHVPRHDPERRAHQQRHRGAVEREPDVELDEAAGETAPADGGQRAGQGCEHGPIVVHDWHVNHRPIGR
jgi:hypothetical protein